MLGIFYYHVKPPQVGRADVIISCILQIRKTKHTVDKEHTTGVMDRTKVPAILTLHLPLSLRDLQCLTVEERHICFPPTTGTQGGM